MDFYFRAILWEKISSLYYMKLDNYIVQIVEFNTTKRKLNGDIWDINNSLEWMQEHCYDIKLISITKTMIKYTVYKNITYLQSKGFSLSIEELDNNIKILKYIKEN